ncbi:TPA: regulator [Serratia marcescens]|jgi:excisionase family DNA binding protein|uniref:regulator n=1 Tax=Serratia TaxID=613 RepID=UPI0009312E3C|nr:MULTISPECIES: regulator [Serratia]AWC79673.1 regulator [Serratia marcescens]EMD1302570.1 regulator [Serratia marcescens]MBH3058497.1 regulator [Serratia marcescens]MBH3058933.1 regulator [Serratia ureilytica]MBH3134260.1 regulator [Serratia marcescens]
MRPSISIAVPTPHVTVEKYCELTGLSKETVSDMLDDGRLSSYRHRLSKDGKREKVLINMVKLTLDALSKCEVSVSV